MDQARENVLSLDEPDSTDRNIPLGEQPWNTVPVCTIDPVFTATELSFVDDDDVYIDVVEAVDASSTSVTSVFPLLMSFMLLLSNPQSSTLLVSKMFVLPSPILYLLLRKGNWKEHYRSVGSAKEEGDLNLGTSGEKRGCKCACLCLLLIVRLL